MSLIHLEISLIGLYLSAIDWDIFKYWSFSKTAFHRARGCYTVSHNWNESNWNSRSEFSPLIFEDVSHSSTNYHYHEHVDQGRGVVGYFSKVPSRHYSYSYCYKHNTPFILFYMKFWLTGFTEWFYY